MPSIEARTTLCLWTDNQARYGGMHLERRPVGGKSDILASVDIPDDRLYAAINDVLVGGIVERQAARRGARYRIVESD